MGLHARPANMIVKLVHDSKSQVYFTFRGETINAKSILSILTLAAGKEAKITITCEGVDASCTMRSLVTAFEEQFGEDEG